MNNAVNSLSNPSLAWMVTQVIEADLGIIFREGAFSDIAAMQVELLPSISPIDRRLNGATDATAVTTDSGLTKRGSSSRVATEGGNTIVSVQDNAMVQDSVALSHDPLAKSTSVWWLLEIVPMCHHYQDAEGHWHKKWTVHLGKGRTIQQPNPVFHISAQMREQEDSKYKPKAKWTGTPSYVA